MRDQYGLVGWHFAPSNDHLCRYMGRVIAKVKELGKAKIHHAEGDYAKGLLYFEWLYLKVLIFCIYFPRF